MCTRILRVSECFGRSVYGVTDFEHVMCGVV